jgi:hypothetical protein
MKNSFQLDLRFRIARFEGSVSKIINKLIYKLAFLSLKNILIYFYDLRISTVNA